MPPINAKDLKVNPNKNTPNEYVFVQSDGIPYQMKFIGITAPDEGGLFMFRNEYSDTRFINPDLETFYEVGDPDIPTKPSNAVGGRRSRKIKRKSKRSRKNRNRK